MSKKGYVEFKLKSSLRTKTQFTILLLNVIQGYHSNSEAWIESNSTLFHELTRLSKSLATDKWTVLCSLTGHKKRDDTEQQRVCVPYASNCEIFSHTSTPINGFIRQSSRATETENYKKGWNVLFYGFIKFLDTFVDLLHKSRKEKGLWVSYYTSDKNHICCWLCVLRKVKWFLKSTRGGTLRSKQKIKIFLHILSTKSKRVHKILLIYE